MIRNPRLWLCVALALAIQSCAPQDDVPQKGPDKAPVLSTVDVPTALKERLEAALHHVHQRDLRPDHGFWTIFHGVLGMGLDTELVYGDTGKKIKFLDAISQGVKINGMQFDQTDDGVDVRTVEGSGMFQGHQDQFIAEMAQWGMPLTQKFKVRGKDCDFADFCRHSKMRSSITGNQELSWAIIIIGEFFGTNHKWTNNQGEILSFEDVLRYEVDQPIDTAACGGTHRLFGLTWVLHRYKQKGGKLTGVWKDAADRIEQYKQNAKKYQNKSDGSFSSSYVSKAGYAKDVQARIGSTGHVLEWLALALTDDEIRQPWVQDAANALCLTILQNSAREIDGGSLYHATHGLHIYYERLFGPLPGYSRPLIPLAPRK